VKTVLFILIILAAMATLFVLARGVFLMASGRDISGHRQNRLMGMRVGLQALAIILVVLFLLLARGH